jgi:TolB-like protein/Flp pilus assembly protein TadD
MDIRRFLAELKGRGVYRVAAFYAAGSWALLQIADVFFPIMGLPDWAITSLLGAAAIGFPIALVLAWIFEITPGGIVETDAGSVDFGRLHLSPARLLELVLLIALVCLVGFLYLERLTEDEATGNAVGAGLADARPSVAVMAFENMSDDPSAEYFGDGLAEEILNLLARLNELNVAARTSSFYYKGKDVDLREVGRKLGVGHVLEGSVRRSGDRVRVTAQLIEMETGYHVWSETYDRDYSDSFRIQDEIARQVVGGMQVILSENSRQILTDRPVLVPEAYDYYLRGREYLRESLSRENLNGAIDMFERAQGLDEYYVDAYSGLCESYLGLYRLELDPEQFEAARSACQTALETEDHTLSVYIALGNLYRFSGEYDEALLRFNEALDVNPNSVDALDGLAQTYLLDNKRGLAEETFLRALQLQPNYWRGYASMGGFLFNLGRYEEALPYFQRIIELMPDNAQVLNNFAATYYMMGEFEEATRLFKESIALDPTAFAYSNVGSSLFFLGRFEEAVDMFLKAVEQAPEDFQTWGSLADAYRHTEELQELAEPMYSNAIKLADQRLEVNPSDASTMALVAHYYASIGKRDEALQYIARANSLAPENVYVHYNSATAYCALRDLDRAKASLQQAIEMGYSLELARIDANLCSLTELPGF